MVRTAARSVRTRNTRVRRTIPHIPSGTVVETASTCAPYGIVLYGEQAVPVVTDGAHIPVGTTVVITGAGAERYEIAPYEEPVM